MTVVGISIPPGQADQSAADARDRFADLVDRAAELTPPRVLHDESAPAYFGELYRNLPADEARRLLGYAVVAEVRRRVAHDLADCRAGRCRHIRCPDNPTPKP